MNLHYNGLHDENTMELSLSTKELYIGVMSGTSMDGVDCALVEFDQEQVRLIAHSDYPMPATALRLHWASHQLKADWRT